jgi:hypothetical protein
VKTFGASAAAASAINPAVHIKKAVFAGRFGVEKEAGRIK